LTVSVDTTEVVEGGFSLRANDGGGLSLSGHESSFDKGFISGLLVVEASGTLESLRLDGMEERVGGVAKSSKSDVVGSSHVVRRLGIVEAGSVLLVFPRAGGISGRDEGGNMGSGPSGSFKSRVSSGDVEVFLGHLSSELDKRSEDDHQNKVGSLLEGTLDSGVVVGTGSLHSGLGFGGNKTPDHNGKSVQSHSHLVAIFLSGGTETGMASVVGGSAEFHSGHEGEAHIEERSQSNGHGDLGDLVEGGFGFLSFTHVVVEVLGKLNTLGRTLETFSFDDLAGSAHLLDRLLDGNGGGCNQQLLHLRCLRRDVSGVALGSLHQSLGLFGFGEYNGLVLHL